MPPLFYPFRARRSNQFRLVLTWAALLSIILLLPAGAHGDHAIRNSIRLALVLYGLSLCVQMHGDAPLARLSWTLAWITYVVHVVLAFHHFHHWSHAHAVEHVRAVGGVGEGIYASHLFGLLWALDVAWWWLWPASRRARPSWMSGGLHGFMLFMVFNATVVFESGLGRWLGVALFAVLAWSWSRRKAIRYNGDDHSPPGATRR